MGRKKLWSEVVRLTLPDGMKARIAAVLRPGEDRLAFIREAIEHELSRRGSTCPVVVPNGDDLVPDRLKTDRKSPMKSKGTEMENRAHHVRDVGR